MSQELVWFLNGLLTPPGGLVLLGVLGLLLSRGFSGKLILLLTLTLLYLLSTPFISRLMITELERYPALTKADLIQQKAQAIIVLGGGRYDNAPEYRDDTVSGAMLERARYAAWLSRRTGLPIIPSGGSGPLEGRMEADLVRELLEREFRVKVLAVENQSRTTWENARMSRELLRELKISRILLVTHASHMPRAVDIFKAQGLDVTPAPMGYYKTGRSKGLIWDWTPNARYLEVSAKASHEYLGQLWYWLKNRIAGIDLKAAIANR